MASSNQRKTRTTTAAVPTIVDNNSNSDHHIIDAQINEQFNTLQLIIDDDDEDNDGHNVINNNNNNNTAATSGGHNRPQQRQQHQQQTNVAINSISSGVVSMVNNNTIAAAVDTELPNQISYGFLDESLDNTDSASLNYTELTSSLDTSSLNQSQRSDVWRMNYNESAIYLEEGFNNDKFDHHPKSRQSLPAYLVVHNHWFYSLDFIAALLLLSLALFEKPAINGLKVNEGIHASLELLALSIVAIELAMKYRWMRTAHFLRHTRTAIKSVVLLIMICEALVVLIRRDSHFRVTRALRPVFLIDNHYCGGIRRSLRQILQSLPRFIDMLFLLFFFMLVFAILGFYMFSPNPSDPYFSTIGQSFVSLFVLLTTANFPDVMMPSYKMNRISSVFFIAFLIIHVYFLMNIMLAVVYEAFNRIEKEKFRKLLLHRRRACKLAFNLLVTQKLPQKISYKHFEGLIQYYKPSVSRLDTYLMFKTLDTNRSGYITLDEFYDVYEVSELQWQPNNDSGEWFTNIDNKWLKTVCRMVYKLVGHKWFETAVYSMIAVSAIYQLVEAIVRSASHQQKQQLLYSTPLSLIFVTLYGLEACLKLIGFGLIRYFSSGWNRFDFAITCLAIIGLIFTESMRLPFSFVFVLRSIRFLRLLQHTDRYKDILGAFIFIIVKRFISLSIVVLIVYYVYAILGMELFAGYDLENCCRNTSIEQYFHFNPNSTATMNGYYYLNNFSNIVVSYVTLFELMVVNNWFILMDAYVILTTDWSRLYFMTFYIMTLMVITIVVAFVLETFLFRIQYRFKTGDIDKDIHITVEQTVSAEELRFCVETNGSNTTSGQSSRNISQLLRNSRYFFQSQSLTSSSSSSGGSGGQVYKGTRARTKFSLSLNMYCDEIVDWIKKADEEDGQQRQQQQLRNLHSISGDDSNNRQQPSTSVTDSHNNESHGRYSRFTRRALSCVS